MPELPTTTEATETKHETNGDVNTAAPTKVRKKAAKKAKAKKATKKAAKPKTKKDGTPRVKKDLTPNQVKVLTVLKRNANALSATQIGEKTGIIKGKKLIDLENKGYVRRNDIEGERSLMIEITPAGKKALETATA